ncbi:DUF7696 family protein [Microvirga arabica]|uniref:DUF7696 family protein n=1 Tax=Microvirga arabica TaxID=1128671 RepID=UPI00406BD30A
MRIQCEARTILQMSKQERDAFFNGRKYENEKTIDRGRRIIHPSQLHSFPD